MIESVKSDILQAYKDKGTNKLLSICKYLLNLDQLDDKITLGRNMLMLSIVNKDYEVFKYVFPRSKSPFVSDTLGDNILSYMIKYNYNLQYINKIIELVPDINLGFNKCKLLYLALSLKNIKWSEVIVEHSKNLNVFDNKGYSPLHLAVMQKSVKLISLMRIYHSQSFLMNTTFLKLPLEVAVENGSINVVKSLMLFNDIDKSVNKGILKKIRGSRFAVKSITNIITKRLNIKSKPSKKINNEIEIIKLCEKHSLNENEQNIIVKAMNKYNILSNKDGSGKKLEKVCSELLVKIRLLRVKKTI